jgi:hypothetical protein
MNDNNTKTIDTIAWYFYLIAVALFIGCIIGFILGGCDMRERVMFCPECGATYKEDSTYCNHDGHELKEIVR